MSAPVDELQTVDARHREIILAQAVGEFLTHDPETWQTLLLGYAEQLDQSPAAVDADIRGRIIAHARKLQGNGEDAGEDRTFRFVPIGVIGRVDDPEWIIEGWLETDLVGCLFGEDGVGKSFLGIDWAEHIARGIPWHGNPVLAGSVALLAAEGKRNLDKRHAAWRAYHGENTAAPIYRQERTAALLAAGEIDAVIAALAEIPPPLRLVEVDTLNRNLGPGNENDTADMTNLLAGADRIRQQFGCAVIFFHHPGWGDTKRERGSSAFFRGLDWRARLTYSDGITELSVPKMKDEQPPAPMQFEREKVVLDEHRGLSSLVLVRSRTVRIGPSQWTTFLGSISDHASYGFKARSTLTGLSEWEVRTMSKTALSRAGGNLIYRDGPTTRPRYYLTENGRKFIEDCENEANNSLTVPSQ